MGLNEQIMSLLWELNVNNWFLILVNNEFMNLQLRQCIIIIMKLGKKMNAN